MTTTKYIEIITFDEIINQALEQKEEIAQNFLETIEKYRGEYVYFTLIADLNKNSLTKECYITFMVDSEIDNGYVMDFNLKLMTLCTDTYAEDELNKRFIIGLLEEELDKLKEMTTPKNKE